MTRIELWWNAFPACIYEYLLKFKGTDSYHNPILGTGVYAFVHANGHRYQVYYVGKSKDIGNRLYQHYLKYAGEEVSDYWLPYKAELFNGDIYKIFNQDPTGEKYFKREGEGFTKEQRIEVGKQIMHDTYFAFARVSEDYIEKIETALHYAILKKNNVRKYGWLGEKNSLLPNEDIVIKNIYHNDVIKKMLLPSIPEEIIILNGEMKFDSLSM